MGKILIVPLGSLNSSFNVLRHGASLAKFRHAWENDLRRLDFFFELVWQKLQILKYDSRVCILFPLEVCYVCCKSNISWQLSSKIEFIHGTPDGFSVPTFSFKALLVVIESPSLKDFCSWCANFIKIPESLLECVTLIPASGIGL